MANLEHRCLPAEANLNRNGVIAVVAIHIGENHSTSAASFKYQFDQNPLKIVTNMRGTFISQKTTTCVLFTKDKKFKAFGFEAEDQYYELVLEGKQSDFYFFRRFKNKIFNQIKSTRDLLIEDVKGETMPAIDVMTACIKYLSDDQMATFNNGIPSKDVRWIITVPATQNTVYKHCMQTAAKKAGIKKEQLGIVSEPVGASLCCHYHLLQDRVKAENFVLFVPKTKYLVLHAGGDSVDITIHEVQEGKSIKQIYTTRYDDCGGNYIDKAFIGLLADMFGNDVMEKFKTAHMGDYSDMSHDIEVKKRLVNNGLSERIVYRISPFLGRKFEQMKGRSFSEYINTDPQFKGRVTLRVNTLRVDADLAKNIYKDVCEIIIGHLKNILKKDFVKDISTILMVGGFSGSPVLQSMIMGTFPDKRIIIPNKPDFAVLQGAVTFGHKPVDFDFSDGYVPTRFSEK